MRPSNLEKLFGVLFNNARRVSPTSLDHLDRLVQRGGGQTSTKCVPTKPRVSDAEQTDVQCAAIRDLYVSRLLNPVLRQEVRIPALSSASAGNAWGESGAHAYTQKCYPKRGKGTITDFAQAVEVTLIFLNRQLSPGGAWLLKNPP